jgi:hypothetical protein
MPPRRAGFALAVAACVVVLHGLVLLGLPLGAGPALREGALQPLTVRQIVQAPEPPAAVALPAPAVGPPVVARNLAAPAVPAPPARPARPAPRPAAPDMPAAAAPPSAAAPSAAAPPDAERQAEGLADAGGGTPVPTYATRLPPSTRLRYELRRNLARGSGELEWTLDGARYALSLVGRVGAREALGWTSRGGVDAHGLAPERFVVRRRGTELLAANFRREGPAAGRVTFSGPRVELPLVSGVQDRLSWMIQLAAIVDATPALAEAGRQVSMLVVGARGDADIWTFAAAARGPVELAEGQVADAIRFVREPRRPYDAQVEVWLDPARGHLPVRARLLVRPGGESTEFVLAPSP